MPILDDCLLTQESLVQWHRLGTYCTTPGALLIYVIILIVGSASSFQVRYNHLKKSTSNTFHSSNSNTGDSHLLNASNVLGTVLCALHLHEIPAG